MICDYFSDIGIIALIMIGFIIGFRLAYYMLKD